MNSTKLKGDLQPILGSLCQFLLTTINFSKFFDYNLHLFKFVRNPTKEKILIQDPTMPKIFQKWNPTVGNIDSSLCHHYKTHFISFTSTWYHLKMRSFLFSSSFTSSFILEVCSKYISKLESSTTPMLTKELLVSTKRMQMVMTFQQHGIQGFLIIFLNITTPCSLPMNENTRWKLLNLGSNIKENILWALFFSNFLKKERKF